MKKNFLTAASACIILIASLSSCASLQQDVYTSSIDNVYIYNSIEIYEHQFIAIDERFHTNPETASSDISSLLSEISLYKTTTNVSEPYLIARLRAFEGLLYKMSGNSREAEAAFQQAKNLQKGDNYVQLLGSRLEKTPEKSLEYVDSILAIDKNNAVILLEKGKLLYRTKKYKEAIALIDKAFILFDNEGLKDYRTVYNPLRTYIWDLSKISDSEADGGLSEKNLLAGLSLESMVELTLSNTKLLDSFKSGRNTSAKNLIPQLEKRNYISSDMLTAPVITRRLCARFIWNTYVRKNGNLNDLTRYSEKYKKSGRTKSPVQDIFIDDVDFDAILGVIENELMELPDGRNFKPEEAVTNMQFITWIKKAGS